MHCVPTTRSISWPYQGKSSRLADVSDLLRSLGWRVRERDLCHGSKFNVLNMHGDYLATEPSRARDTSCCVGSLTSGITVKEGMRGTQWAQVTVTKHIMGHAVWRVSSKVVDGGWTKESLDPRQRFLSRPRHTSERKRQDTSASRERKMKCLKSFMWSGFGCIGGFHVTSSPPFSGRKWKLSLDSFVRPPLSPGCKPPIRSEYAFRHRGFLQSTTTLAPSSRGIRNITGRLQNYRFHSFETPCSAKLLF